MKSPVQKIALNGGRYDMTWLLDSRAGQSLLAACRRSGERPRCLCVADGVDMYVGRRGKRYYLARMPGTGFLHADDCQCVEEASIFSGAGEYSSGVLTETTEGLLRINANLCRHTRAEPPIPEAGIDGLFDLLIEQAALNQISPGTERRTWASVRDRLLEASAWILLDGEKLSSLLFLPEPFVQEASRSALKDCENFLTANAANAARPALLCAPFKAFRASDWSWQLILKHLPGLRLWVAKDAASQMEARWEQDWFSGAPEFALCLALVKPGRHKRNYTVSNLALAPTDINFFPCANTQEAQIAQQLLDAGHALLRPLRFDADPCAARADFAIVSGPAPEPVFVLSAREAGEEDSAKRTLALLMQRNRARAHVFHVPVP